jgi:hypothetical protein
VTFEQGVISEAGATLRVARLEVLLERVRINAARPRPARVVVRAASVSPVSVRSDDAEIDYEDFADAEVVEIDVDEPSVAPAVPSHAAAAARASASPTAYSMSFVDEGLPDGISPLTEGGETLASGVVSTNPPGVFGDDDGDLALHSPQHDEPPTWQADAAQPTMEQLGNTIGLDVGGHGPALELDVQSVPPVEAHDLEVSLPTRGFAGAYDEGLAPPETAQQDLAQYSQGGSFGGGAFDERVADGADTTAIATDVAAAQHLATGASGAHVVQRSEVSPIAPVAEIVDSRTAKDRTFVALLDDSMSLINR